MAEIDNVKNIRLFHNWIKRNLISDAADYIRKTYGVHNIKLLDLAVGRGGDLNKWYDTGIHRVLGFDIDKESVDGFNGAVHRYKKMIRKLKEQGKKIPSYRFFVMDLSDNSTYIEMLKIVGAEKFDIISCQFAIHYFFKNKDTLDTFVKRVSSFITKNGIFISTLMDGEKLIQMFKKNNVIDKKIFYLENKMDPFPPNTPYGNTYIASLGTEEDKNIYFEKNKTVIEGSKSVEFVVDLEELKKVFKKYGLVFVGQTKFDEWYDKYTKEHPDLFLSDVQKEWAFANQSLIFKNVQ